VLAVGCAIILVGSERLQARLEALHAAELLTQVSYVAEQCLSRRYRTRQPDCAAP
jgi:hypothetical protein